MRRGKVFIRVFCRNTYGNKTSMHPDRGEHQIVASQAPKSRGQGRRRAGKPAMKREFRVDNPRPLEIGKRRQWLTAKKKKGTGEKT